MKYNPETTLMIILLVIISLTSCNNTFSPSVVVPTVDESDIYYSDLTNTSDWSESTHTKLDKTEIVTNTSAIFNTSSVQKMRIVIEPENWEVMQANFTYLKAALGSSTDFTSIDDPFFIPCQLFYSPDGTDTNELQWYKVGIRFKGNSSLYNTNSNKLPFKLDFDEFEDTYSAIKNQRFYGFKQLNLKNNYQDESEMHEIVATELFRSFGFVVSHCSFYKIYINVSGGDKSDDIYYGLYTLVEEVDDTVIKTQYADNDGNLYKPEEDAATFANGTYHEDEYGLKTDDDETYTDIAALYAAINDSLRTSDITTWKANLEALFDVDIFLKWLAANSVMQNWDTYGVMPHNFYLYKNPESGKFEWIPWDNNEALISNGRCLSLSMSTVSSNWPLIKYILDDSTYKAAYKTYVNEFATLYFNSATLNPDYTTYSTLIQSSVSAENSGYTFTSSSLFSTAVNNLQEHTVTRNTAAINYAAGSD